MSEDDDYTPTPVPTERERLEALRWLQQDILDTSPDLSSESRDYFTERLAHTKAQLEALDD